MLASGSTYTPVSAHTCTYPHIYMHRYTHAERESVCVCQGWLKEGVKSLVMSLKDITKGLCLEPAASPTSGLCGMRHTCEIADLPRLPYHESVSSFLSSKAFWVAHRKGRIQTRLHVIINTYASPGSSYGSRSL